ncbi:SRPBCC family protein [Geodermatophilus sp. DSM 44513]|uniref:SRPBCC family protein n=1 Tax=Geodermatophilus sp. DSM 44513 TaxID=1528104 RepID=UPI001281F352|nr:SRPBCC family protein [Geodermatophilus sp. DSM 44513]WNV76588.1 SRPBCC family protein [Geodermatophilus sp. DSM 44513]
MPELRVSVDVEAPVPMVWRALVDWERQGEWMPLTDVRVVGGDPHGVGGRIEARTGVPTGDGRHAGLLDTLEITGWDPPRRVDVLHTGRVVRGPGVFEVVPRNAGATVVWTEHLDLPLGRLGRLAWPLVRPFAAYALHFGLSRFRDFARRYPS